MSGTHGVFQHRSGYFFTMLEEDFCEVYKRTGGNEIARAYITSILENLTNKQYEAAGRDDDIWVYMSLPEMARRMRHAYSERTIHKELQGMIKDGYLSKRRATGKATMEYKLNLRKLRRTLEALPEKQSCNSTTYLLANLQDQSGKSARLTLQNYKNDLAELQPRIPREEQLEEQLQDENTRAVFADASTAHAHFAFAEYQNLPIPVTYAEALAYLKPHGPHDELDAVEVMQLARKLWTEAHPCGEENVTQGETDGSALDVSGDRGTGMAGLDCGEPVPEPELDDEETAERPAIRVGEVALHAQVSASKLVLEVEDRHSPLASEALPPMASDVGTFSMTPQEDTPPPVGAQTQVSSPAQLLPSPQPTTARPAAGSESPLSTTQRPADGKRQGKAEVPLMPRVGPPPMPPEDEVWGFPVILAMFDHWRGHEPITPKHMKQVNDCAIGLYRAGYTRALLVEIRKVMAEDEYYANRFVDLCDVANNAHKYRARAEANLKRALMPAQTQTSGRIINYTRQRKAEEARKAASLAQGGMN